MVVLSQRARDISILSFKETKYQADKKNHNKFINKQVVFAERFSYRILIFSFICEIVFIPISEYLDTELKYGEKSPFPIYVETKSFLFFARLSLQSIWSSFSKDLGSGKRIVNVQ